MLEGNRHVTKQNASRLSGEHILHVLTTCVSASCGIGTIIKQTKYLQLTLHMRRK